MFTLFRRKPHGNDPKAEAAPQPLRIEGIPEAPFTAEPDDAELAAQALLEMMARPTPNPSRGGRGAAGASKPSSEEGLPSRGGPEGLSPLPPREGPGVGLYYQQLANRIREAKDKSALQATRFIYNCELMLQNKHLPLYGEKSVQMLEMELYKRIDVVEREGGELKRRWQHCLADVTVRLMNSVPPEEKPHTDNTEKKDGTQKAQKHAEGHF